MADDNLATSNGIRNGGVPDDYMSVASLPAAYSIPCTGGGADTDGSQDCWFVLGQSEGDRDGDQDGLVDSRGNCPDTANPLPTDIDTDAIGDTCDTDLDADRFSNCRDC
jgi:hypothetical protein